MVSTSLLKDETLWPGDAQAVAKYFVAIGERGQFGQSSTSGIAENGVMFFTQVHKDDIGCWDINKTYNPQNLHRYFKNGSNFTNELIQFPNDLKVDHEQMPNQSVWVMSNRLPIYLYSQLDYNEINFRIIRANIADLIANTVCDPLAASSQHFNAQLGESIH